MFLPSQSATKGSEYFPKDFVKVDVRDGFARYSCDFSRRRLDFVFVKFSDSARYVVRECVLGIANSVMV